MQLQQPKDLPLPEPVRLNNTAVKHMAVCAKHSTIRTHDVPVVSLLFAVWPSNAGADAYASAMCAYADVHASAMLMCMHMQMSMQVQCICVCMCASAMHMCVCECNAYAYMR